MIQLQDSRFVYNWRKNESEYPSYDKIRPEFDELYEHFKSFVQKLELGKIEENQWEISYINHLIKGQVWNNPSDWKGILPWLSFPHDEFKPDSIISRWDMLLPERLGRLHISVNHGRTMPDGPEALIIDLTARGPISADKTSLSQGLKIGHEAIVSSFAKMISVEAANHFERTA